AEFSAIFARTRPAYLAHEKAKTELKSLVPEDAQQAVGHGVRARRSKNGVITFELHVNLQPRLAFNVDLERTSRRAPWVVPRMPLVHPPAYYRDDTHSHPPA